VRVAVVGGHGQIARHLHPLLREAGHEPVALVRSAEQGPAVQALGAQVRLLDIEAAPVDGVARAVEGCDAVVFSAGAGPDGRVDRKRTVDFEGSIKAMEAARRLGVRRFVQVSAIGVDEPLPPDTGPVWRAYVQAKRDADAALRESGLDWTIIRPGRLTDEPATGLVDLGVHVAPAEVPRADVALVLAAVLDEPRSVHRQWNLVAGDTPVGQALDHALAEPPSP
jgi:uncharacterized protein YbjT (DUF2867 family)